MEPVTHVLLDRSRGQSGLGQMVGLSFVAHGAALAALVVWPVASHGPAQALKPVMTISLGGAPGPRAGGMTPMGGRPVQAVDETPRPHPLVSPAPRAPEMTEPGPRAAAKARAASAPEEAKGRTLARGAREQAGSSIAETGGRGIGFGLSTGGGGTGGYLDVGNFCCPEYLTTMLQLIQRNWNAKQEVSGDTLVKFTIRRDGMLTDVDLEQSSGYAALDLSAQRAVMVTRQLPPLPAVFTENTLTVHLKFQYQR